MVNGPDGYPQRPAQNMTPPVQSIHNEMLTTIMSRPFDIFGKQIAGLPIGPTDFSPGNNRFPLTPFGDIAEASFSRSYRTSGGVVYTESMQVPIPGETPMGPQQQRPQG